MEKRIPKEGLIPGVYYRGACRNAFCRSMEWHTFHILAS